MKSKKTLLYVDDEPINLKVFELNFCDLFDIITAESGAQALEIVDENSAISAIVTDMSMPGMDGAELIEVVNTKHPHLLFFMLTGFEISNNIAKLLDNGVLYACFQKPMNISLISKTLTDALGSN